MIIFSTRLDETGIDELSEYTTVGGAVATVNRWDILESEWEDLLRNRNVSRYHWVDFHHRKGDFKGWGRLKCENFVKRQEKIIRKNTVFRVAAGIHEKTHAFVKEEMRGTKGFPYESNYTLCFRYLANIVCDRIKNKSTYDFRVNFLIEDGPWAAEAVRIFHLERNGGKDRKPAPNAQFYGDILVAKKGEYRSLEAADYIVRDAHLRMIEERPFPKKVAARYKLFKRADLMKILEGMQKIKKSKEEYQKLKRARK